MPVQPLSVCPVVWPELERLALRLGEQLAGLPQEAGLTEVELAYSRRDERGYWLVRTYNGRRRFDVLREWSARSPEEQAAWLRGLFDSEGNAQLTHRPARGRRFRPAMHHRRRRACDDRHPDRSRRGAEACRRRAT